MNHNGFAIPPTHQSLLKKRLQVGQYILSEGSNRLKLWKSLADPIKREWGKITNNAFSGLFNEELILLFFLSLSLELNE